MHYWGKIIIMAGAVILLTGIIIYFFGDRFSWFGNLPGDIKYESENTKIYIPITSMILVSIIISLILWLIRKFSG